MNSKTKREISNTELLKLKKEVYFANMLLYKYGLVIHTWGNVSGITNDRKYMVIKPSGVSYETMTWEDMVVVDLNNNVINSKYNPSSDTPTHTLIYKVDKKIKGIAHTHSPHAVAWAQAGIDIPCFGTTHADNFYGPVFCTRELKDSEITEINKYEHNTGLVILEEFKKRNKTFEQVPAILVKEHGPFTFSINSCKDAVNIALTLEEVAKMAIYTVNIVPNKEPAKKTLQDKHYYRKHGINAYYGQNIKAVNKRNKNY